MNTLDALFSRQVPARGASGAEDATRQAGAGSRAGRGQDGFAAALNGQAKGARDGGRHAQAEDDAEEASATVGQPRVADGETAEPTDADAAQALLEALIAEIQKAGNRSTDESDGEGRPDDDAIDPESIAADTVLGDDAVAAIAAAAADADAAAAKTGTAATGEAALSDAETAPVAADLAKAGRGQASGEVLPRIDAARSPERTDGDAEASGRSQAGGKLAEGSADAVRAATQSGGGGDARGSAGGEAGRNGAWASRAAEARQRDGGQRVENVRTVESRSYAAPAMSANAEALVRTIAQAGETSDVRGVLAGLSAATASGQAEGANASLHLNRGQQLHTLKIQLNPADLGQVTAIMRLTGEELSVELRVETAEAYRQLNNDSDAIVRSLRAQGYGVEQVTVQHFGSDRSATGGQGGQPGFSSGQQFQAGAEQGNGAAGGMNEGRRDGGGRARTSEGDIAHEASTSPGSPGDRSGDGVYL